VEARRDAMLGLLHFLHFEKRKRKKKDASVKNDMQ
jgi:hypothetical protein